MTVGSEGGHYQTKVTQLVRSLTGSLSRVRFSSIMLFWVDKRRKGRQEKGRAKGRRSKSKPFVLWEVRAVARLEEEKVRWGWEELGSDWGRLL